MDRNHDGVINGGGELFGVGTILSSGLKAANGYQALAELDANADGAISVSDTQFADLMVWVDGNSDGVSQNGELHSLSSLGIAKLDLSAQDSDSVDHGNILGLVSSYTTNDGASHQMADVWFAVKDPTTAPPTTQVTQLDASTDGTAPALQSQVSQLVDSLAAFAATQSNAIGISPASQLQTTHGPTHAVLDALRQFDPNGKSTPANAVAQTLRTSLESKEPGIPKMNLTAVLAVSKG